MTNLVVLLLAALAFQAAFAGVTRYDILDDKSLNDDYAYKTDSTQDLETYYKDFENFMQKAIAKDNFIYKNLIWQSGELAQYVDVLANKLQTLASRYQSGLANAVIVDVIKDLGDVRTTFERLVSTTNVDQLKGQFFATLKTLLAKVQKLWRLMEVDHSRDLRLFIKGIIYDLVYYLKNFKDFQIDERNKDLVKEVKEATKELIKYMKENALDKLAVELALGQYLLNVRLTVARLDKIQVTDAEVKADLKKLLDDLRAVSKTATEILEREDFDLIKARLVKELEEIVKSFEKVAKHVQGTYEALLREIIVDYYYAIEIFKYHVAPEYQTLFGLEGFWGKNVLKKENLYKDLIYNKHLLRKDRSDKDYAFDSDLKNPLVYKKDVGYDKDLKGLENQFDRVVRTLLDRLENLKINDIAAKQQLVRLAREYLKELEIVVEDLERVVYTIGSDFFFEQLVAELKSIVGEFEQFVFVDRTTSIREFKEKYISFIRKFASTFQKVFTVETKYTQNILARYLEITTKFFKYITVVDGEVFDFKNQDDKKIKSDKSEKYTDKVVELYEKIQRAVENLTVADDQRLLTVQIREFAQILKDVVDQLQTPQPVDEVVYKLKQVAATLERPAFAGAYQLKKEIRVAVSQLEKLIVLVGDDKQLYYVVKNVFETVLKSLVELTKVPAKNSLFDTYNKELLGAEDVYGLQGKSVEFLLREIETVATELAQEFETVVDSKEIRQLLLVQIRQLVQVVGNIVDRFQFDGTGQVVEEARLIGARVQLQRLLTAGPVSTVYQLKSQLANCYKEIGAVLERLAVVGATDVRKTEIVKSALVQYLLYLRNVQYQLKNNLVDFQRSDVVDRFPYAPTSFQRNPTTTFDRIPTTTFDRFPATTVDRFPTTTFDRIPTTTFDRFPTTTYGRVPTNTFERIPTPTFDRTPTTTFDRTPTNTFETVPTTTFDRIPTSTFQQFPTNTFERVPTATYDTIPTSAFQRFPTNTFERVPTTTYDKFPTTTYDKFTTAYDKFPTSTYDRFPTGTSDRFPTTTYDRFPATTYDRFPTTTYDKLPTTTYDKFPTTTYDRFPTTTYDRFPTTTYDKLPTSSYDKFPTTTYDRFPTTTYDRFPTTYDGFPTSYDKFPTTTYDKLPTSTYDKFPTTTYDKFPTTTYDRFPTTTYNGFPSTTYNRFPTTSTYDGRY